MKMKNTADHAIRIPADMIDPEAWDDSGAARPTGKVTIPAGAVVDIRDEYAVRSRAAWSRSKDGDDAPPSVNVIDATITTVAPQLKPHGPEAERMAATMFHDELPAVRRAFEELARAGAAERGEVKPGEARPRFH